MEQTSLNEVLVEPELAEGEQAEDVEMTHVELLDTRALFSGQAKT
jgi:hypothetical protein